MHGIILFFLGLFLAGPSGGGEASNLYPVAVLTETPAGPAFYTGMNVVFSSGSSYDPDGYVVQSKFYINGVLQQTSPNTDTYSTCFALHDYPQAGCYAMASGATTVTLKLEVKDNSGYSRSVSKEYVIKESRSKRYFIKDHLGSVRATVDELGTVIGYDDYYPFGLTMPGRSSNTGNPNDDYKFTGHELDDEANLNIYHMNARAMDPVLGRFMQIDPLADQFPGWSPYNYTMNNPLKYTDPTGMAPEECPPCDFEYMTRYLFQNFDDTYIGDLFRADAQGQLDQKVSQDLKDAGNATVDAVAEGADKVSDASTVVAIAGIVGAPFTGGSSLTATGYALGVGTAADITSTTAKTVDAVAFDGSSEAAFDQFIETSVNIGIGKVAGKVAGSYARVNSAGRFFNPSNGQFVTNKFGFGVTAASDATRVAVPLAVPTIIDKVRGN